MLIFILFYNVYGIVLEVMFHEKYVKTPPTFFHLSESGLLLPLFVELEFIVEILHALMSWILSVCYLLRRAVSSQIKLVN